MAAKGTWRRSHHRPENGGGAMLAAGPPMKLNPLRWALATRIIAGLVTGAAAGLVTELIAGPSPGVRWAVQNVTQPIGSVFLRIIFMVVIPLIFSAIVLGVAEMGDIRKLGKA